MPKAAEISSTFLVSELKKRPDIFHENGSLQGKTCVIWKDLQTSLRLRMQPQSLYLLIYKTQSLIDELRSH